MLRVGWQAAGGWILCGAQWRALATPAAVEWTSSRTSLDSAAASPGKLASWPALEPAAACAARPFGCVCQLQASAGSPGSVPAPSGLQSHRHHHARPCGAVDLPAATNAHSGHGCGLHRQLDRACCSGAAQGPTDAGQMMRPPRENNAYRLQAASRLPFSSPRPNSFMPPVFSHPSPPSRIASRPHKPPPLLRARPPHPSCTSRTHNALALPSPFHPPN